MSNVDKIKQAIKALPNSDFMWDMATSHKPVNANLEDVDMQWWDQINSESSDCSDYDSVNVVDAMFG